MNGKTSPDARDGRDLAASSPPDAEGVDWPPLFSFRMALPGTNVFREAVAAAARDALQAGDVLWCDGGERLEMVLVLEPDRPEEEAELAATLVLHALRDALVALLPPQVEILAASPDRVRVNGGDIARVRHALAGGGAVARVVACATINMRRPAGTEGGEDPGTAVLEEEGAPGLSPAVLVAETARRFLLLLDGRK